MNTALFMDFIKRFVPPIFLEDFLGLDSNSTTPSGYQIQVTDKFITQFKKNLPVFSGGKKKLQMVKIFNKLFADCPKNGYLTPESVYEDDYGREVRIGRAADEAWRTAQSFPKNKVIVLNGFFYHNMSTQAETSIFKQLTRDFKELSVDLVGAEEQEDSIDVSGLSDDEIEIVRQYKFKFKDNLEELNKRLSKFKSERAENYNLLAADGFNDGDIEDFLKDTLISLLVEEHNHSIRITEQLLQEANRQQLLQKSRNAQDYSPKNRLKGKNRYDRRTKSSISATVRDYNMIQMDPLFKRDILEFKIPVMGETDVYTVDVRVDGLLAEIRKQIMANKGTLEFKVVLQSLMKVLNIGNVYIGCNCPDARYRMAYQQTKNDYKAGYKETRPSDITNPNDTLGAGCKHVLLVLANLDWAVKVASVINNYIKYCKEHLQRNYADYIFPKIYGVKYDKAVQLQLFDNGLFPEDIETMNAVIDQGFRGKDKQGKFVKDNEFRFQKTNNQPEPEEDNPLGLEITSDTTETEVEEPEEQQ